MIKIKRARVGSLVKADATGTGEWIFGSIMGTDGRIILIRAADNQEVVRVHRDEVYKATQAEVDEFAADAAAGEGSPEPKSKPAATKVPAAAKAPKKAKESAEDEDDEEEDEELGARIPEEYRKRYKRTTSPSGNSSLSNGDKVAETLGLMELEAAYDFVATETQATDRAFTSEELKDRYQHLNLGMQRMNLGNMLRRVWKETGGM